HAPCDLESVFQSGAFATHWEPTLNLNTALRFHLADDLHEFVATLLESRPGAHGASAVAERVWSPRGHAEQGLRLWGTRSLDPAKGYLRERYGHDPDARYGILASSRDRMLPEYGIDNTFAATKVLRVGPWFVDAGDTGRSCRALDTCATEFAAQGLELDMALVGWGSDFRRLQGRWTDADARRYSRAGIRPVDPYRLRTNAYRVLLTRGRDGSIVFIPPDPSMDETWQYLLASGFRELPAATAPLEPTPHATP